MVDNNHEQETKKTIRKTYSKIALQQQQQDDGAASSSCCASDCCSGAGGDSSSPTKAAAAVGYDTSELESIPQASVLGVGCGAPVGFADLKQGETVVDLGSGAGIDVFLSSKKVGTYGKVIGIDMTDEMLERAIRNAKEAGYINVEFRKGDIEKRIPIEDNYADVVISNCVINLTMNKVNAFEEVYRILKSDGRGRMVISDLVTDSEIIPSTANAERWSSCIDGALTKEHYIDSIKKAGFHNVEVLSETQYTGGCSGAQVGDGRKISNVVIKTVKP
ncbi:MAG: arsenite methyltransferase [Thermoproteota archaeon]|nr:arsenite methyltransferase [Thermoproteota archaeon]